MPAYRTLVLAWLALGPFAGCAETYCQSGAKYGTECYSGADVRAEQRAQGRQEPPSEMKWWAPPPRSAPPSALALPMASAAPASSPRAGDAGADAAPER
jgi:hypothetical protein